MNNTLEFFNKILPDQGYYIAAVKKQGRKAFIQKVVADKRKLASVLLSADRAGHTAYHACASFTEDREEKPRAADNALFVRSQWLDIDVGQSKDYPTRKVALKALVTMCRELEIPVPMIVFSGIGIHAYWLFDQDYPAADFKINAEAFHKAMLSVGFTCDVKRTRDVASVLRPVGCHHRKGDPIEVTLFRDAEPLDPHTFYSKFEQYVDVVATDSEDSIWSAKIETDAYPPSSAKKIVRQCKALAEFATHKQDEPDVSEDHWRGMLGLLKHTSEGEKLAHLWSQKSDKRYTFAETQDYLDRWHTGPTTCQYFSDNRPECHDCPHWGKVKSPILLGFSEDAPPPKPEIQDALPDERKKIITKNILQYANQIPDEKTVAFWPPGYSWDGQQLRHFEKNADGVGDWIPFSNTLYYPFLRYETEDKTRAMMVCALTDPKNNVWRVFELETAKAADARQLASALGAQEIVYMPHSKERNQKFVQDVLMGIRAHGMESTTYNSFGWHGNGFVIGDRMITSKGSVPVFLGSKVPTDLQGDFGKAGTTQEWVDLVDQIYNRLGAEAYQFIICCGFASPMVMLCDSDMWHGIPTGVTGGSGEGKTTICLVACSAFGNPRKMMIQANEEGTTLNALIQRIATMRHLPMLLDEITGRDTAEVQATLFSLSNGEPKRRLRSDGTELNPGLTWDMNTFITGNLSIMNLLADSDRVKADATQVRCFEIPLEEGTNKRVFKDVNGKDLIENQLLSKNYGVVGEEFLKFVIRNREKVMDMLQKERAKLASINTGADPRERFYYDLIATTMTTAGVLKKLGLIDFDLTRLRRWALNHVETMRALRSTSLSTAEDYMQSFIAYLYQHTVVTKYYRDGRQNTPSAENVQPPMRDPLARHATEDKRFIVTQTAFHNWCKTQNVTPGWLWAQLEKENFVLPQPIEGVRQRICKGTKVSGIQARCIEFNYEKLDDSALQLPDYISVVDAAEEGNKEGS